MKKGVTIFARIFGGYFFITVLLVTLTLLFSFKAIKGYYIDSLTGNLKNLGVVLSLQIAPLLDDGRFKELDLFVKKLGKELETRITIVDTQGKPLADSEKDPGLMENHKNRPEILEALDGKIGKSLRYSATLKEEMLYVAMPLEKGGNLLGTLRVSLFLSDINSLTGNIKTRIIYIAIAVVSVSLIIALLFSRNLSNPIKKLVIGAQQVASGDFTARVFLKSRGEIKGLADSFNTMTEKVESLFTDLSLKKDELAGIISSIQAGLVVINKEGKVMLCNDSFMKVVNNERAVGSFYYEILRGFGLCGLIKKIFDQKANLTEEVELNESVFLCGGAFIASKQEVVLVLHDMTETKNLEKIKKDFVVNVSHELRTPLTAIKGFVETLDDEVEERHKYYLDIIKKHTDRLVNIVNDLLLLSELEETKLELNRDDVDLVVLLANVMKMFEQRIRDNGLTFKLETVNRNAIISADSFKLEQMFINLLDNAIKYTENGAIKISLTTDAAKAFIEIADTGIGVPRDDINRIFERFYVVDKSRSRKLGGTGLGLSIVKHIAILHNGSINVESEPGNGTKFTISLPLESKAEI